MEKLSAIVAQQYAANRSATAAEPGTTGGVIQEAAQSFLTTLQTSEAEAMKAMTSGNADPHTLVQALAQTELAVEAVVTVRDKVVEAYQEILRMPV